MHSVRRNQLICFAVAVALGVIAYRGLNKSIRVEPGSAAAARFVAAKKVAEAQGTDPVRIEAPPVVQGDRATVQAVFGVSRECTVKLVRSDVEKHYGWVVADMACGPAV